MSGIENRRKIFGFCFRFSSRVRYENKQIDIPILIERERRVFTASSIDTEPHARVDVTCSRMGTVKF